MGRNFLSYVLFGKEAIEIYNMSIVQLLITRDVKYNIGKFSSIEKFKNESKKWDDFIEIDYKDYIKIKKHFKKNKLNNGVPKKKKSFWKFITGNK